MIYLVSLIGHDPQRRFDVVPVDDKISDILTGLAKLDDLGPITVVDDESAEGSLVRGSMKLNRQIDAIVEFKERVKNDARDQGDDTIDCRRNTIRPNKIQYGRGLFFKSNQTLLFDVLDRNSWVAEAAARELGIDRKTLIDLMPKFGIGPDAKKPPAQIRNEQEADRNNEIREANRLE